MNNDQKMQMLCEVIDQLSDKVVDLEFDLKKYKAQYYLLVSMVNDIKSSLENDKFIEENEKEYLFKNLREYVRDYIKDNNVNLNL